jgi:D-alanyl-D-alanine dipeptidase
MNHLVEVEKHVANVHVDLRYATVDNITGTQLYPLAKAYLIDEVADALSDVQTQLQKENLGVVVWDAYRPLSVSKALWEHTDEDRRAFVADPSDGSIHNRGCAIDLTLRDLKTQLNIEMPSEFDDFDETAFADFAGTSEQAIHNRTTLIRVMAAHSFDVNPLEWWHYNWRNWQAWPVLDIPIEDIEGL